MKVLVTGTQGYIGSVMTPLLRQRGHDVTGLDAGYFRDETLYDGVNDGPCEWKDTRDVTAADLEGVDAVVHLGDLSNDPLGQMDRQLTYEINYRSSVRLATLARDAGVARFLYSSSCSVYGVGTGSDAKTESSPLLPQTAYAECKALVEKEIGALAGDHFSPTLLRNATAFGPSARMRFDIVVNNLTGLAHALGTIRLASDGTPWRPLVHVQDICEAFAAVLEAPREAVHGEILNVGDNDENYQVRDIAQAVAVAFPDCRIEFGKADGDNRSYRVSFDKIRERLPALPPRRTLSEGVAELRDLYVRLPLTREMFESRSYTRILQLKHLIAQGLVDERLRWVLREAA